MKRPQKTVDQKFSFTNRFLAGLVIALSFSLTAFEWTTITYNEIVTEDTLAYIDDDLILDPLRFRIEEAKKPKPVINKKTTEIKVVEVLTKPDPVEPITEPVEPELIPIDKGLYGMVDEILPAEEEIHVSAEFFAHYDKCKGLHAEELYQCTLLDIINRIQANFTVPLKLKNEGMDQKAYMSFVVNKEGEISDIKVERTTHPSMGKAATKAIAKLPAMNPATQKGKKVSLKMNVPINLNMQ
jgi:protein TonB